MIHLFPGHISILDSIPFSFPQILSDLKLVVLIAILVSVDVILLGVNEYMNRTTWAFKTVSYSTNTVNS